LTLDLEVFSCIALHVAKPFIDSEFSAIFRLIADAVYWSLMSMNSG